MGHMQARVHSLTLTHSHCRAISRVPIHPSRTCLTPQRKALARCWVLFSRCHSNLTRVWRKVIKSWLIWKASQVRASSVIHMGVWVVPETVLMTLSSSYVSSVVLSSRHENSLRNIWRLASDLSEERQNQIDWEFMSILKCYLKAQLV